MASDKFIASIIWFSILCSTIISSESLVVRMMSEQMKCTYGERGSLTATCVNATPSFFKATPYRFDQLDETLVCVNCSLKTIDSGTFDITGNQIKKLDLQNSLIKSLRQRAFVGMIFLEKLVLSHNEIDMIIPGTFGGVKKIQTLNLEYNEIYTLSGDGFLELIELQELNLAHNKIELVAVNSFNGLRNLKELDLSHNAIAKLPNMTVLEAVRMLHLQYNNIVTLTGSEFYNLTNLNLLDLSHNKLMAPNFHIAKPNKLLELDISDNQIMKIPPGSFKDLSTLETLNINYNQLLAFPQKSFQTLFSLRNLLLSYNKLTKFETGLFTGLPQLRVLNCSHNSLESLEVTGVLSIDSLHTLDVSYNNLTQIDYVALISRLPRISYLEMQNNQLACDLEQEMEEYFDEDNIKYILYKNEVGAVICVNNTMPSRKKVENLVVKDDNNSSSTAQIFLFVLVGLMLVVLFLLGYTQYYLYQMVQYGQSPKRTISRVQLISELERRDPDILRE